MTLKVAVGIGHDVLGIQVFKDGSLILNARGRAMYDVAPACSGMRSLIAMAALSVIYAFMNFKAPWKRLAVICAALPMAVVGNIARITTVIIVGDAFGQKWGMVIEEKFGFLTFAVAIAGMLGVGRLLRDKDPGGPKPPSRENRLEQPELRVTT